MDMAGLRGKERSLARDLSGGWKQRLALGCTIIHSPHVIFLDEPTAGVDPLSRRFFWELIQQMASRGTTVFVTTHYMDEAEHCHRLGLMHEGKLIAVGSPSRLKADYVTGTLLEVATTEFTKTEEVLSKEAICRHCRLFGSTIHVIVDDVVQAKPVIERTLKENGITVHSIRQIPFTLEDIFITLIEEQDMSSLVRTGAKGA